MPGSKKKAKVVAKKNYLQWVECKLLITFYTTAKTKFLLLWDSVVAVKQTDKMFTLLGLVLANEAHEGLGAKKR